MCKILVVLLCLLKFTSLFFCGGASSYRAEDDTADVSVGLATTADGSPEVWPESEKSVGNDVRHRFKLLKS